MAEHTPAYVREHGPLEVPLRVVKLDDALATLKQEPGWTRDNRLAHTLAKQGNLRVVLTVMRAGAELREHKAEGALTLQCVEGRLRLRIPRNHPIELVAGEFVALDAGVSHTVEAVTECAFLLTIAQ